MEKLLKREKYQQVLCSEYIAFLKLLLQFRFKNFSLASFDVITYTKFLPAFIVLDLILAMLFSRAFF